MNILGQAFSGFVTEQIITRQLSLGRGSGNNADDLLYQQTKTPWIRLVSSIDLEENTTIAKRIIDLGFNEKDINGDSLAKNFILQGGSVSTSNNNAIQSKGLNIGNNKPFSSAYGWGGTTDRGLIPMPGITGASVKYQNNGALSKTEIKIKCYSKNQLSLIDALYMRPGYTLLLEFGWSVYLDNEGKLQTYDTFLSPAALKILEKNDSTTQFDVIGKIQKERKITCGNYEGVYGKVNNFKWSFNPDGSYDVTINLTGLGDILETLKVNITTREKGNSEEDEDDGELPIIANKNRTTINKFLFNILDDDPRGEDPWYEVRNMEIDNFKFGPQFNSPPETLTVKNAQMRYAPGTLNTNQANGSNETPQCYITFGYFIAWLQHNVLLKNPKNNAPVCNFDMDFAKLDEDENFISSPLGQFSPNPLVCLIPYADSMVNFGNYKIKAKAQIPEDTDINTALKKAKPGQTYQYDKLNGRLSNLYININHIAKVLDECPETEDNTISLLAFLNQLLTDITKTLGGINDLSLRLDDDQITIKFIENTPQIFEKQPESLKDQTLCKFNTFGITPGVGGSIIRNLGIDGSIPSNFSSMVTIGAQSNGNQVSGNATSFSNYNTGLTDRVIPIKEVKEDTKTKKEAGPTMLEQINESIKKMCWSEGFWDATFGGAGGVFGDVITDSDWLDEDIETLQSLHTTYINLLIGYKSQPSSKGGDGTMAAPFFLPFNLSLDIDGISGIKIFQKFIMDGKVLPPMYNEDTIDILVKSTDHEVTLSSWVTKIGTQSTPARIKR